MLSAGPDYAEVYTEVTRSESKKSHAHVSWKLKNFADLDSWSKSMNLMPVMSNPTLRIEFSSKIAPLRPGSVEDLKLRVRIPEEYTANHLILMLKLKQEKKFVGPTMLLFVKIINRPDAEQVEESSFVQDDRSDGSLNLIKKGVDVYNEQ